MNKKLVALVAAAMMTVSAGSVFAAPVDVDGSISFQARHNTKDGEDSKNYNKFTFKLNAKTELSHNVDFYARLAGQRLNEAGASGADFYTYNGTKRGAFELDQYGFDIKGGGFDFKLGRQAISIGANSTIYNSTGQLGKYMMSDGLTVTGKSGVFNMKAIAVREDRSGDNEIYALQGSYSPAKNWTLGSTFARGYAGGTKETTTFWGINAGYAFSDKASISTEYVKSNANSDNKAYNIGFFYTFDDRLSGYIINHKTEANANIRDNTDFDSGEKGFYYGLDYKVAKNTTFSLFYKANNTLSGTDAGKDNTSLRGTLSYTF